MARSKRSDELAVRLTAYVHPKSKSWLEAEAHANQCSVGALLDRIINGSEPQAKPSKQVLESPIWRDHPGWRLNSLGQNVCTACGGSKSKVKNQSCRGAQ